LGFSRQDGHSKVRRLMESSEKGPSRDDAPPGGLR
jgi:hypothetical protein